MCVQGGVQRVVGELGYFAPIDVMQLSQYSTSSPLLLPKLLCCSSQTTRGAKQRSHVRRLLV